MIFSKPTARVLLLTPLFFFLFLTPVLLVLIFPPILQVLQFVLIFLLLLLAFLRTARDPQAIKNDSPSARPYSPSDENDEIRPH